MDWVNSCLSLTSPIFCYHLLATCEHHATVWHGKCHCARYRPAGVCKLGYLVMHVMYDARTLLHGPQPHTESVFGEHDSHSTNLRLLLLSHKLGLISCSAKFVIGTLIAFLCPACHGMARQYLYESPDRYRLYERLPSCFCRNCNTNAIN